MEDLNQKQYQYFMIMKDKNFRALHDLAEICAEEIADLKEDCNIMDYASYKIIKEGSNKDISDMIKYYIAYYFAKYSLSMPK